MKVTDRLLAYVLDGEAVVITDSSTGEEIVVSFDNLPRLVDALNYFLDDRALARLMGEQPAFGEAEVRHARRSDLRGSREK